MNQAIVYVPPKYNFPIDEPIFLTVDQSLSDDSVIYCDDRTVFPEQPGVYRCNVDVIDEDGTVYLYGFVKE